MANRTNDENLDLFYLNIEQDEKKEVKKLIKEFRKIEEKILKKIIRIMQN